MLILPFIQHQFDVPKIRSLKGAYTIPEKPGWNFINFLNRTFQDSMNTYIEQTIGYRPHFVRLHNQLQYSLFDTINARGVIMGKEGYLFEMNYIKAYYGLDFVGDEKIAEDINKTIVVNNWLKENNKMLLVVLAPGKGSFFPEYIPDELKPESKGPTNYNAYYDELKKAQIAVIGGNHWFNAMKDTSRLALFPKSGIHWSYYGLGVIFDSVFKLMEDRLDREFINFEISDVKVTRRLKSPDRDLWEGMNILIPYKDYPMPYPEFKFEITDSSKMPRVITVADSYYWQWFEGNYALKGFKENSFWYYNNQIYYPDDRSPKERALVSLMDTVVHTDVFLLLQTDANMDRFGFGFIDELYELLKDGGSANLAKQQAIAKIAENLRKNESMMEMIRDKALKRGLSIEEMIKLDAVWIYDHRQKENNP
ncbi:MAG: hypothetical protein PHG67_00635 [Bacteroidales bacterium]|nr:hypothetical protein [Bacteroidales bacterium]